jgi:hypothetical protein
MYIVIRKLKFHCISMLYDWTHNIIFLNTSFNTNSSFRHNRGFKSIFGLFVLICHSALTCVSLRHIIIFDLFYYSMYWIIFPCWLFSKLELNNLESNISMMPKTWKPTRIIHCYTWVFNWNVLQQISSFPWHKTRSMKSDLLIGKLANLNSCIIGETRYILHTPSYKIFCRLYFNLNYHIVRSMIFQ